MVQKGERYDFILNANQSINNYLIRTKGYADCNVNHVFEVGILRYADAVSQLQDLDSQMFENLDYHSLIGSGLVIKTYFYPKEFIFLFEINLAI